MTCLLLLPLWESVIALCYFMSILVCNQLCFASFVFLVSRDCCVALPCGTMGLSAVCGFGIS